MRIVTYLGFTLLSILIQFSVMDYIQSSMQQDEKIIDGLNGTSLKRHLKDVLKDLSNKPHALYYQTENDKIGKNAKILDNTSHPDLLTTELTTTVLEVLYDESTSVTEDDTSFTTEEIDTSTELENVTEITFFGKTNKTKSKPNIPKTNNNQNCKCNFLYGACDVNCCCDVDCTEDEIRMFKICVKNETEMVYYDDVCYDHLFYFGHEQGPLTSIFSDWFCIVKVNLPHKQTKPRKTIYPLTSNQFFTWKGLQKPDLQYKFANKIYSYGDPIWLFKNGSIYYIDLPMPMMNSYCSGRRAIHFLKEQKLTCLVKIGDLEMIQILKSTEETKLISATSFSMNTSILNCSNLHCVNWTLLICEDLVCTNYNKSMHEPVCTGSSCANLALKLEYIFNYHDSKITNATIKFHIKNIPLTMHFLTQEIAVKFILTNQSIDKVLKLSGNPGYIENMPVIVSYAKINYTDAFYNKSSELKTYIALPGSKDGVCVPSNLTDNVILFGKNRRTKCRYYQTFSKLLNSTEQCKSIQHRINKLLNLQKFAVSPLGDPEYLKDNDWFPTNVTDMAFLYGELNKKQSKLHCYNLITRYSFIFSYAEIEDNNRILDITLDTTSRNACFSLDDLSMSGVMTIDVSFVDVTRPNGIEYASSPNLYLHLPNDFFLPFPSNESQVVSFNVLYLILYGCIAILICK